MIEIQSMSSHVQFGGRTKCVWGSHLARGPHFETPVLNYHKVTLKNTAILEHQLMRYLRWRRHSEARATDIAKRLLWALFKERCQKVYSVLAILHPHHDSPLILVELRRGRAAGSTAPGLEGLKREAPGRRKCFGVLNRENTHVNEARRRAGACSAQYWGGN